MVGIQAGMGMEVIKANAVCGDSRTVFYEEMERSVADYVCGQPHERGGNDASLLVRLLVRPR